jgi:protein-L-isoaspartate O-methyltransferase
VFPLTLDLVDFLCKSPAQTALAELGAAEIAGQAELRTLQTLRRVFSADQSAALLDQARLRARAAGKFPEASRLLFTDDALQQASTRSVATYRAQQFATYLHRPPPPSPTEHSDYLTASPTHYAATSLPHHLTTPPRVADLGCGIGADTIALAAAGLRVLAVERDPVRARLAEINVAAVNLAERVEVVCADWTAMHLDVQAAFVDPSRRSGEHRIFRLAEMEPPLPVVLELAERLPALAVKTMPGIGDTDIPAGVEVEFISERGAMKEALLRFGGLRSAASRRATLLPGPHQLDSREPWCEVSVGEPLAFLYEPDSAILRATLVQHLATQLGATQLDPTIAYLTTDRLVETPFAMAWRVLRHGPFHLKTLNHWLRTMNAGEVVVKKRGSAIDPDEFRQRLKTSPHGRPLVVFLTRVQARPWMIVGSAP